MFATITSNHKPVRNLPICRRSISLQYKRREESTPAFWGRFRHFSWCRQTRIGSKTAAIVAISKPYSLGFIQLWPVFTLKAQKTTFIQADSRQRLFFLWRTREDSNLWPLESEAYKLNRLQSPASSEKVPILAIFEHLSCLPCSSKPRLFYHVLSVDCSIIVVIMFYNINQ